MDRKEPGPGEFIDTVAPALDLQITDKQRPGVEQFLGIAGSMNAILEAAEVPDTEADQAPVFRPGRPSDIEG